jgi:hypothetical protein
MCARVLVHSFSAERESARARTRWRARDFECDLHGNTGSSRERKSEDAATDGGERDRLEASLVGQPQGRPIRRDKQLVIRRCCSHIVSPRQIWPHRVNHKPADPAGL